MTEQICQRQEDGETLADRLFRKFLACCVESMGSTGFWHYKPLLGLSDTFITSVLSLLDTWKGTVNQVKRLMLYHALAKGQEEHGREK